jgi:hypothetical protein
MPSGLVPLEELLNEELGRVFKFHMVLLIQVNCGIMDSTNLLRVYVKPLTRVLGVDTESNVNSSSLEPRKDSVKCKEIGRKTIPSRNNQNHRRLCALGVSDHVLDKLHWVTSWTPTFVCSMSKWEKKGWTASPYIMGLRMLLFDKSKRLLESSESISSVRVRRITDSSNKDKQGRIAFSHCVVSGGGKEEEGELGPETVLIGQEPQDRV